MYNVSLDLLTGPFSQFQPIRDIAEQSEKIQDIRGVSSSVLLPQLASNFIQHIRRHEDAATKLIDQVAELTTNLFHVLVVLGSSEDLEEHIDSLVLLHQ